MTNSRITNMIMNHTTESHGITGLSIKWKSVVYKYCPYPSSLDRSLSLITIIFILLPSSSDNCCLFILYIYIVFLHLPLSSSPILHYLSCIYSDHKYNLSVSAIDYKLSSASLYLSAQIYYNFLNCYLV